MANLALAHGRNPLSPTPTSLTSLRHRSPPLLGPDAPREVTPPLDHTYPLHFEMRPTKGRSVRPYSEAALPGRIPRAGVHLLQVTTNLQLLNTADPGPVSLIRPLAPAFMLTSVLGPHYQIRSPGEPYLYTPTSSRTGSSASLHPGTPSVAFLQPLSRSASYSQTPKKMPSRPALKSTNTWAGTGTTSSVGSTCIPNLINTLVNLTYCHRRFLVSYTILC
jgi:hypothetical protein